MPIRDFVCDVDGGCGKEQERVYSTACMPTCESCGCALTMLDRSNEGGRRFIGAVFPFTTNHIDPKGKPMVIESMGHLRSVERSYGVVLSAFSQGRTNLDPIKDPPRYRAGDPDFLRR